MSRWQKEFENHAIWQSISDINDILELKVDKPSEEYEQEKRRLSKFLIRLEDSLKAIDSELFPKGLFDQVSNAILSHQNFLGQLQQFKQNKNHSHLVNANNYLGTQMHLLVPLFSHQGSPVQKLTKSVERQFDQFVSTINDQNSSYNLTLDQLQNQSDKIGAEAEQYKSLIETRQTEISNFVEQFKTEFTDAQNERSNEFSDAQITRNNKYDEWRKDFENEADQKIESLLVKRDEQIKNTFERFKGDIQKYHDISQDTHYNILELYELVANDSVKAGYMKNSQIERSAANFWRWVSIVFILSAVGWIGYTYFHDFSVLPDIKNSSTISVSSGLLLAKVIKAASLGAILIYGAIFASRQSSMHRENEKNTRQFALEISALDPFISSMPEEKQIEIKEKMTDKMFGRTSTDTDKVEHFDPNLFTTFGKVVTDILKAK